MPLFFTNIAKAIKPHKNGALEISKPLGISILSEVGKLKHGNKNDFQKTG